MISGKKAYPSIFLARASSPGSSLFHSSLSAIAFWVSSSFAVVVVGAVLQLTSRTVVRKIAATLSVVDIVHHSSLKVSRESCLPPQDDQLQTPVQRPPLVCLRNERSASGLPLLSFASGKHACLPASSGNRGAK